MKFDSKTLQVMKNFATINPSLQFKVGNVLKTISPSKTVLGVATVPNTFEKEFAIYDVSRFMSVLSLFNDPEIELGEKSLTVSSGDTSLKYLYAAPSTIIAPPEKELKLPSNDVQFTLTNEMFTAVSKAMGVLGLPGIAVVGDGANMYLQASDSKGKIEDKYSIKIGETDKKFNVIFKAENLKILPMNYEVSISSKGISQFKGEDIEYWIATDADSKFE